MTFTRRRFLEQTGMMTAPVWSGGHNPKRMGSRPNIVLIMADDLGYGHLGCYGQPYIQTPSLNVLAREGMRFTQAYAGCSLCAPSRCVLMTGKHGGHISVRGNGGGVSLLESDVTIAQILKQAGYATGLFGKWGLGEAGTVGIPNRKGFDEFFGYLHQLHAQFYYPEFLWDNTTRFEIPENVRMQRKVYAHDLILEKALDFVRRHRQGPFFLYLPVTIPHHEFIAPEAAMERYRGRFDEKPLDRWREGYALPVEPKATLAAMISHLDTGVGRLMALLHDLRLVENTLLLFTSDNGPANGPLENPDFFRAAGPLRGYKGSLYEGGLRVPMLARWPGHIKPDTTTHHVTYFPDIMPTLAELAGIDSPMPAEVAGISLLPTLLERGTQPKHKILYWESAEYQRIPPFGILPETRRQAIRMGDWKGVKESPSAPVSLYDLAKDVSERHNLAGAYPEQVEQMADIMAAWHREAPPQTDVPAETAERLYVPGAAQRPVSGKGEERR